MIGNHHHKHHTTKINLNTDMKRLLRRELISLAQDLLPDEIERSFWFYNNKITVRLRRID